MVCSCFCALNYANFKDMLSANESKTQHDFIGIRSKPVLWMILKCTNSDTSAEKDRNDIVERVTLPHAQLEHKKCAWIT